MMRVFAITFARISLRIPFLRLRSDLRIGNLSASLPYSPQLSPMFRSDRFCPNRLDRTERRRLFRDRKSDRNFRSAAFFPAVNPRVPATRPHAGMALHVKPTAEQGNALSHAGKAKRISPCQRLIYLKADSVILNG